jgi:hypothetical protein
MTDIVDEARPRPRREVTPDLPIADRIPDFASDEEAAEFFDTHDISGVWDQLEDVTNNPPPELRPGPGRAGSRARKRPPEGRMDLVSLRLPAEMIDGVKAVAARRHLPYQALMRSWIGERLEQERASLRPEQDGTSSGT